MNNMEEEIINDYNYTRHHEQRDYRKQRDNKIFIKTRPCRNIVETGSCNRNSCMFAHNENEIQVSECSYGDNCFRKDNRRLREGQSICKYKHPSDSIEEYYIKLGCSFPLFPENKKEINIECSKEDIFIRINEAYENDYKKFKITITN